ncbi:MAG: hypothetical protein Q8P31_09885 [Bacillota bacterium]|nr:hypothetical protein [Bacillota bacterium]
MNGWAMATMRSADDAAIRSRLLSSYGIEIGGGLGPLKGRVWRIGLMGHGATRRNVLLVLTALGQELQAARWACSPNEALAAAEDAYGY